MITELDRTISSVNFSAQGVADSNDAQRYAAELRILSDNEFEIGGMRFVNAAYGTQEHDPAAVTTAEKVVILKPAGMLEFYRNYFLARNVRTVLEFGIYQGGSPIALTHLLNLDVFVGIDLKPPLPALDALLKTKGWDSRISLHYQMSQSDTPSVRDVIRKHFSDKSLDLIIDDASHEYEHSVRSFEAAFPYLKPGGNYVIEDWGWSHWPHSEKYAQNKAHLKSFSNLVFELTMACASSRNVIESLVVRPAMVIVEKARTATSIDPADFALSKLYRVHGRTFHYL